MEASQGTRTLYMYMYMHCTCIYNVPGAHLYMYMYMYIKTHNYVIVHVTSPSSLLQKKSELYVPLSSPSLPPSLSE